MNSLTAATMARFALVMSVLSILMVGAMASAQEAPTPSCPAGYELSEDGTQCVATGTLNACAEGYAYDAGSEMCTPQSVEHECPNDGSVFNDGNGQCEYPNEVPACPSGYMINPVPGETENLCISISDPFNDTTTFVPQCSAGYTLDEDLHQCTKPSISGCAAGFAYDTETDLCVSDGSGDVASSCPEGTAGTVEGGECSPDPVTPSCPTGYYFDGTDCVEEPTCDAGSHLENHVCVADAVVEAPAVNENSGGGSGNSGGGGGGGGGSYVPVVAAATTTASTTPQVLGAATSCFQFSSDLSLSMTSTEVTELQKILIAKGHLNIAAPTGYFGPMTQAAVKAFQAANSLEQTGVADEKTRTLLNVCPVEVVNPNTALILELYKKLAVLLEQIKALKAAQSVL